MSKNGRIPDRMVAYLKPEEEILQAGHIKSCWSFPTDARETQGFSKCKVRPAFVVPEDSEAFKASAAKWVSDSILGVSHRGDTHGFENKPFTNLRWIGIDRRSEGGVAYKVVTEDCWLIDLREDVVMECLFEGKIERKGSWMPQGKGIYFTAQFIWVVIGSQSRIVRVGSKVHEEIVQSNERRAMKDIPDSDLEIGGIYQNRQGKQFVLIARGKKYKYLMQELHHYGQKKTLQQEVDDSIAVLDQPSVLPYWYWWGSMKVVQKIGTVKVPEGLGDRFDQRVKAFQESTTLWDERTSR